MDISREQSATLKGLAITIIIVHNFVDHLLEIKCNEMSFNQERVDIFLSNVFSENSFWYILSYAGWIGVPVFLFLSGYGLTRKYNQKQTEFNIFSYLQHHIVKLVKLFLPLYVIYVFFDWGIFSNANNIKSIVAHMTFTINFFAYGENDFRMEPGVYWFFGAILQFYIIFIFIRKLNIKCLCALCLGFLLIHFCLLFFASEYTMKWCRHNFLGWGVSFVLGIIAAKAHFTISNRMNPLVFILSFITLCVSLINKPLSPLVEVSAILFFLSISNVCKSRWIYFLGVISPSIFVVHPFVRLIFYNSFCSPNYPLTMTTIYLIPVILLSWIHHIILHKQFRV